MTRSKTTKTRSAKRRRAVIYVRVSRVAGRDQNGDSYISPSEQIRKGEDHAEHERCDVVEICKDENKSGGNNDRPGLQRAIKLVEDGKADCVIVSRLNRFGRSVRGILESIERLEDAGGELLAADMPLDPKTPAGKLVRGMLMLVAEFELEMIKENIADAQANAIASGKKIAKTAPIGYRFKTENGRRVSRLERDPAIAPHVPDLFRLAAIGSTTRRQLVDFMHERTGRLFYPQTLLKMIENRVYLGEVRYGDLVAPKELWHEALVTEDEFNAAQRERRPQAARSNSGSLLAGLLVCGTCDSKLTSNGTSGKPRYSCQHQANGRCKAPVSVRRPLIDEFVEQRFLAKAAETKADRATVKLRAARDRKISKAEAKLAEIRDRRERWQSFDQVRTEREDVFLATLDKLEAEEAAAQAELDELLADGHAEDSFLKFVDAWPTLDQRDKRHVLGKCGLRVTVHRSATPNRPVPMSERTTVEWLVD